MNSGSERSRTDSYITSDPLRAQLSTRPFILTEDMINRVLNDGTVRLYSDYFQEMEEGKKYKG